MAQVAAPLEFRSRPQPDAAELKRVVGRLRRRLGVERTLHWGLRGLALGAVVFTALSLVAWLTETSLGVLAYSLAFVPVVGALVVAVLAWPSSTHAARTGDRRLGLDERLGTALELVDRNAQGRFDALQVRDAVDSAATTSHGRWLDPPAHPRLELMLAGALCVLAVASLGLRSLPRPSLPTPAPDDIAVQAVTGDEPQPGTSAGDVAAVVPNADADAQAVTQQPPDADPDLANRVQVEQGQREALDRLSQALGKVSAGQPAADAIQNGDYSGARDQLSSLADDADQLSDAAKQQLSRSLQQAAGATNSTDRSLADRERQAANALSRGNYNDQRQALKGLADQVPKSAQRSA